VTPDALVEAVRNRKVILFVGAGLSLNLDCPSWKQLVDQMAAELDYDPGVFHQLGDLLQLAEFFKIQKTALGSLRSWMDRSWHKDESRVDKSRTHQAIVNLSFPTIYTTNYDRWLEIAFQRRGVTYTKIANVGDFTEIKPGHVEIVKFHGDLDDDSSLVLTEASYFDRLSFESPLDLKLRADIIGKSVLFIGYSLSDINMRYLLYKVHLLWTESEYAKARPKSYIFLTRPNAIQEAILTERGITPIVDDTGKPGEGLSRFLEELALKAFGKRP
jgi:SIR2-like domain